MLWRTKWWVVFAPQFIATVNRFIGSAVYGFRHPFKHIDVHITITDRPKHRHTTEDHSKLFRVPLTDNFNRTSQKAIIKHTWVWSREWTVQMNGRPAVWAAWGGGGPFGKRWRQQKKKHAKAGRYQTDAYRAGISTAFNTTRTYLPLTVDLTKNQLQIIYKKKK